jgi:hypothetical protein
MWDHLGGNFGEPVPGALGLGQVVEELVEEEPEFSDELVGRCAQRTWAYRDVDVLREATDVVHGALALQGWRRRPFRDDEDYSSRWFDPSTVPAGAFDAHAVVLLAGEMAFRTYPGKHAFFDPESEPARARAAALVAECEWLWSTIAELCGCPGVDGRLLRETAASWPDDWYELLDHVVRLQRS